jgi:hypothetical protein
MPKNVKNVCIRLSNAEFECLRELADSHGDTHTAEATKLVVNALEASIEQNLMEKQFVDLERKLINTMFWMLTTVANHNEQERIEYRKKVNKHLKAKG